MTSMRNYEDDRGEPALRMSLVCYADILGWRSEICEALQEGRGLQHLREIRRMLSEVYNGVREKATAAFQGQPPNFEMKAFTDNIVVAFPTPKVAYDAGERELEFLLSVFAELQAILVSHGFLLRGAIAFGQHYMDEDFAYGDALLEAVKLEESGGPPRIVLARSALDLVKCHIGFWGEHVEITPHYHDLLLDADGHVFLDYLSEAFTIFPDGPILLEMVDMHRAVVERGLSRFKGDKRTMAKYEWMAGYQNFVCQRVVRRYSGRGEEANGWEAAVATEAEKLLDYVIQPAEAFPQPTTLTSEWYQSPS